MPRSSAVSRRRDGETSSFLDVDRRLDPSRVAQWCTWAAAALAAAGGVVAIAVTAGGSNRVLAAAPPLIIGAAALVAAALTSRRVAWLGGLLYAAASLAVLYGMVLALLLPLRLSVEGTCPPAPSSCPLGFERPATSAENFAVYAAGAGGALAVVLTFVAVEARYLRRSRPKRDPDTTAS
jgi:hypothetical protein